MFRLRRVLRRRLPLRPPGHHPHRPVPPPVAEAERLFRVGDYARAVKRFDSLVPEAVDRGRLEAAGDFSLRAARCYLELGDLDQADERAVQAVDFFIQARRPARVRQVLPRILAALEQHGCQEQAERLQREVQEAFQGEQPLPGRMPLAARSAARLPAQCPACGAPIKPNEVSWVGPGTAECPYCSGVIKAE